MKLSLLLSTIIALTGCQVMPDLSDTTPATLRFRVHYQAPGLTTPMVEIETTAAIEARRCIYVNEPFGVVANVHDDEGVRSITIGPSAYLDAIAARTEEGDILVIPLPAEPMQPGSGVSFPNPGNRPDSAIVSVLYSTEKAYSSATLMSVYTFRRATLGALRATARNFGSATGVSEVYNFYVRKAEADNPTRQAGMPCELPRT